MRRPPAHASDVIRPADALDTLSRVVISSVIDHRSRAAAFDAIAALRVALGLTEPTLGDNLHLFRPSVRYEVPPTAEELAQSRSAADCDIDATRCVVCGRRFNAEGHAPGCAGAYRSRGQR